KSLGVWLPEKPSPFFFTEPNDRLTFLRGKLHRRQSVSTSIFVDNLETGFQVVKRKQGGQILELGLYFFQRFPESFSLLPRAGPIVCLKEVVLVEALEFSVTREEFF